MSSAAKKEKEPTLDYLNQRKEETERRIKEISTQIEIDNRRILKAVKSFKEETERRIQEIQP